MGKKDTEVLGRYKYRKGCRDLADKGRGIGNEWEVGLRGSNTWL